MKGANPPVEPPAHLPRVRGLIPTGCRTRSAPCGPHGGNEWETGAGSLTAGTRTPSGRPTRSILSRTPQEVPMTTPTPNARRHGPGCCPGAAAIPTACRTCDGAAPAASWRKKASSTAIVSLAGLLGRPVRNQTGRRRSADSRTSWRRWADGQVYPPVSGLGDPRRPSHRIRAGVSHRPRRARRGDAALVPARLRATSCAVPARSTSPRTCSTTSWWTSRASRSSAPPTSTWPRSSAGSAWSARTSRPPPCCAASGRAGGAPARRPTASSTGPPSNPSTSRPTRKTRRHRSA